MARSTLTKRLPPRPIDTDAAAPWLDLGAVVLPQGTLVTATTVTGKPLVGSLLSVDYRDGIATTAAIYVVDGPRKSTRHVYADTVSPVV